MLERYLVEHCSPTLASIKTANLFNMPYDSWEGLASQLESLTQQFTEKGISLSVVRKREGTGSYGWGDGEWMRSWEETCRKDKAELVCDSVICNEEPGDEEKEACRKLGKALAQ
nr:DUF3793 family protein [uncultured Blautia sp.]